MVDDNRRFADKFALRLPEGMRDRIAAVAETNNRSMNSEIVARLEETFRAEAAGMLALVPDISDPKVQMHSITVALKTLRDEVDVLYTRIDKLEGNS